MCLPCLPISPAMVITWSKAPGLSRATPEIVPPSCLGLILRTSISNITNATADLVADMDVQGITYKGAFHLELMVQDSPGAPVHRLGRLMGHLPIMVRSTACYLRHLSP